MENGQSRTIRAEFVRQLAVHFSQYPSHWARSLLGPMVVGLPFLLSLLFISGAIWPTVMNPIGILVAYCYSMVFVALVYLLAFIDDAMRTRACIHDVLKRNPDMVEALKWTRGEEWQDEEGSFWDGFLPLLRTH